MDLLRAAGHRGSVSEDSGTSERSARVVWQCADIRLAHVALGWAPSRSLQVAVRNLGASVLAGGKPVGEQVHAVLTSDCGGSTVPPVDRIEPWS